MEKEDSEQQKKELEEKKGWWKRKGEVVEKETANITKEKEEVKSTEILY
jgi:hypothetical protein